jgi:CheY-like chemotaxis protein
LEAARRIRSSGGPGAKLPILALTATATVEDRNACLAAGMNDYLSKPITFDHLRAALARWQGCVHEAEFSARAAS